MARGGLGSSNGATLQRSKLDLKQEVRTSAPKLDDGMGGGGIGKGLFNGGGGDGGDGDDDDYFNEFGDGDEGGDGDGFFRRVLGELYDARSISAVLEEWFRTMADLPVMIRMAAQMGLFSSAALVRFMAMDVRPGVTRFVTRALPASVSRAEGGSGGCRHRLRWLLSLDATRAAYPAPGAAAPQLQPILAHTCTRPYLPMRADPSTHLAPTRRSRARSLDA